MTALHLVRVPVATDKLARWARERFWTGGGRGRVEFDEGRALHHLVAEALGPGALRPFRLLVPPRRTRGNLYAYSALEADTLRTAAQTYALPDHLGVLSVERLESKRMPGVWRVGQRLGFDVRARPVRRLLRALRTSSGIEIGAGAEVDAFLREALNVQAGGMAAGHRTRQDVYVDWLAERLAPAAALDRSTSRLARFHRVRVDRGQRGVEGPDATIQGVLTVSDPAAFAETLSRGVGRHRAYGYGMLLLRPPNRPAPAG